MHTKEIRAILVNISNLLPSNLESSKRQILPKRSGPSNRNSKACLSLGDFEKFMEASFDVHHESRSSHWLFIVDTPISGRSPMDCMEYETSLAIQLLCGRSHSFDNPFSSYYLKPHLILNLSFKHIIQSTYACCECVLNMPKIQVIFPKESFKLKNSKTNPKNWKLTTQCANI